MNDQTPSAAPPRVWLITDSSRGFGRALLMAALARGDRAVATARRGADLSPIVQRFGSRRLLATTLDVTDPRGARRVAAEAVDRFGRIDVVANHAHDADSRPIAWAPPAEASADMTLFGIVNVTRAVLPTLRAQRSGLIYQFSDAGRFGTRPDTFDDPATFDVDDYSQVLADEVRRFGVRVSIVETGAFRAGLDPGRSTMNHGMRTSGTVRAARHLVDLADRDEMPLRVPMRAHVLDGRPRRDRRRLEDAAAWTTMNRRRVRPEPRPQYESQR